MDIFEFRVTTEESVARLWGKNPDHLSPQKVINDFMGGEVATIGGSGMMIHLIIPIHQWENWEKYIGNVDDFWGEDTEDGYATLKLHKLREQSGK